jgi:hypothetical protein
MKVNPTYENLKYWCIQLSVGKAVEVSKLDLNIDVGRKTVRVVFQPLRDICSRANKDDKRKLGCRSMVIEIDESLSCFI